MKDICTKTRFGWAGTAVTEERPRRRRFSWEQYREVLLAQQTNGWLTVMPEVGLPFEKIPLVHKTSPLAGLVIKYAAGIRSFEIAIVEQAVGFPVTSVAGARRLAKAGLGMVACDGMRIDLRATNPDQARLINESRCRGEIVHKDVMVVAGLALSAHGPDARPARLTEDMRTEAFDKWLGDWNIRVDGMSWSHGKVTLVSEWYFDCNVGGEKSSGNARPR